VAKLEKIGFTPYWLAVPKIDKQILKASVQRVKEITRNFGYPYNRKIAEQLGHFTTKDYRKWL
jgi:hypothetical protein